MTAFFGKSDVTAYVSRGDLAIKSPESWQKALPDLAFPEK